jgi:RNA polymerase sigma factor for flagellar operon FliA
MAQSHATTEATRHKRPRRRARSRRSTTVGQRTHEEVAQLWQKYKRTKQRRYRNVLVEAYLPLVRSIAQRIWVRLPDSVDLEDLVSAGTLGLIDAVHGFDCDRGVCFKTYCVARIRGSILDDLRGLDWAPRMVRSEVAKIEASRNALGARLGRPPAPEEVADDLGMSLAEYTTLVNGAAMASNQVSLDRDPFPNDDGRPRSVLDAIEDRRIAGPHEETEKSEFKELVTDMLNDRERSIMLLYYYHQLTMREIGQRLSLSESRVCQMHARILKRLRTCLSASESFAPVA